MSNGRISPLNDQSTTMSSPISRVIFACLLGLSLAGCNDASGGSSAGEVTTDNAQTGAAPTADSVLFDVSLEETPCEIMPKEIVAKTFNVPVEEIEKTSSLSSTCAYEWEGDGDILDVSLGVDVFDTAQEAASSFGSTTRGISAEEVSDAMAGVMDKAEETGALDTEGAQGAAKELASGLASGGLHFEDVGGVAEKARFGTRFATLYLLQGNLKLGLSAYHGPGMTLPESAGSIMDAIKQWQKETLPARKQQSIELAKAIVEAL